MGYGTIIVGATVDIIVVWYVLILLVKNGFFLFCLENLVRDLTWMVINFLGFTFQKCENKKKTCKKRYFFTNF